MIGLGYCQKHFFQITFLQFANVLADARDFSKFTDILEVPKDQSGLNLGNNVNGLFLEWIYLTRNFLSVSYQVHRHCGKPICQVRDQVFSYKQIHITILLLLNRHFLSFFLYFGCSISRHHDHLFLLVAVQKQSISSRSS